MADATVLKEMNLGKIRAVLCSGCSDVYKRQELVCYTGERIEILIPFVYTSKDFYRKLQYLIGHCALMKLEFSRWSEYHIPLHFEIVGEEPLPAEVMRAIDALNQGEERCV